MVSLILAILLIIFISISFVFFKLLFSDDYYDDELEILGIVMIILLVAIIAFSIWVCSLAQTVATANTIKQKIEMYQAENAAIEESIDVIVRGYMDFESTTFKECRDKDGITLVSLFPELKSDSLVQQQIDIYVNNNKKIKELKEQEIDLSKARWKLSFGR